MATITYTSEERETEGAPPDAAIAERAAEKARRAAQKRLAASKAAFERSPRGQARAAKVAGDRYFQTEITLEENVRLWGLPGHIATTARRHGGFGALLTEIETEGWSLVEAGWLCRQTAAVGHDRLRSSEPQPATEGRSVGVYLFRDDGAPPLTDEPWVDASDDVDVDWAFGASAVGADPRPDPSNDRVAASAFVPYVP